MASRPRDYRMARAECKDLPQPAVSNSLS